MTEDRDEENEATSGRKGGSLDGFELETAPQGGPPPVSGRARVRQLDLGLPVSGRYKLDSVLGEGGMATVYVASDTLLEREVAIKCIKAELKGDSDTALRFHDEAKIMSLLAHPGSVPVHDLGKLADGRWFLAMKKVRGATLRDLLSKRSPDDVADRSTLLRFIDIFERVCETIAAAHDQRIMHRDIKPENVMIDDFHAVYVMDWGLSKILPPEFAAAGADSGRTMKGEIIGTPAYMAPEQARGKPGGSERQSDVFSLGVMLYEILTGNRPFSGLTVRDTLDQVIHSDPPNPRTLNPSLSRYIAEICMKALAKDPAMRYPSAAELADDVRRFRQFLPVSAARPRLLDRLAAWYRRSPRVATALGTSIALFLLAALWTTARAIEESRRIDTAFARVESLQKTVDYLDERISESVETLANTPPGSPERPVVERQLAELRSVRRLEEELIRGTAFAVIGVTLISPDTRAQTLLRDDFKQDVTRAIDSGDDVLARTLIAHIMNVADDRNAIGFTPADIAWMKAKLHEVDERIRERGERVPELPSLGP